MTHTRHISILVAAAAIGSLVMVSGSAARDDRRRACDPGVETAPGNPPPRPKSGDLFVRHSILLVDASAPKTHEFLERPGGWWWLKTLVMVRGRRSATLSVPPSERGRLHLRYGGDARTVTFRPCNRRAGQWSYYPGGFVYSERGCYAIDIRIQGTRPVRRHIPLGVGAQCTSP